MRVAKGIVSKVLKTVEGDGGQQWTIENYDEIAPKVDGRRRHLRQVGLQDHRRRAVAVDGGPMKYAGTLPIMDPPRHRHGRDDQEDQGLGVDVKMITGDHLNIAKELARQVDLGVNIHANTSLWPGAPRATT